MKQRRIVMAALAAVLLVSTFGGCKNQTATDSGRSAGTTAVFGETQSEKESGESSKTADASGNPSAGTTKSPKAGTSGGKKGGSVKLGNIDGADLFDELPTGKMDSRETSGTNRSSYSSQETNPSAAEPQPTASTSAATPLDSDGDGWIDRYY